MFERLQLDTTTITGVLLVVVCFILFFMLLPIPLFSSSVGDCMPLVTRSLRLNLFSHPLCIIATESKKSNINNLSKDIMSGGGDGGVLGCSHIIALNYVVFINCNSNCWTTTSTQLLGERGKILLLVPVFPLAAIVATGSIGFDVDTPRAAALAS